MRRQCGASTVYCRDPAIVRNQIKALQGKPDKYIAVPKHLIPAPIQERFVYKQVGKRTVIFVGKRTVGYAIGAIALVDVLMLSYWALDTLDGDDDEIEGRERANQFRAVLGLPLQ